MTKATISAMATINALISATASAATRCKLRVVTLERRWLRDSANHCHEPALQVCCADANPALVKRRNQLRDFCLSRYVSVGAQFCDVRATLLCKCFSFVHQCNFLLAQLTVACDLWLNEMCVCVQSVSPVVKFQFAVSQAPIAPALPPTALRQSPLHRFGSAAVQPATNQCLQLQTVPAHP